MKPSAAREIERIDAVTSRDRILIAAHRQEDLGTVPTPDKVAALVDSERILMKLALPHALIGGVAVGIHSEMPRATLDTDIAVQSTAARPAVVHAFVAAGFRLIGEFPHSINFRHPSGEPVQLAIDAGFDAMIGRAESVLLRDVRVPIVTRVDLIAMKERAASDPARRPSKRLRDEADVALLREGAPDPDEGW